MSSKNLVTFDCLGPSSQVTLRCADIRSVCLGPPEGGSIHYTYVSDVSGGIWNVTRQVAIAVRGTWACWMERIE